MNFSDFVIGCTSLFLKYKTPMERTTRLVTKIGNANIPTSKGLIPAKFSKPPNVVNKSAGKIAGIMLKKTTVRVAKNTAQVTKEVFDVAPDSILLSMSFNIIFKGYLSFEIVD